MPVRRGQLTRMDPDNVELRRERADLYVQLGQPFKAIRVLERLVEVRAGTIASACGCVLTRRVAAVTRCSS